MTFTAEDLDVLSDLTVRTWREAAERDWSAPAGTLEWSCTRTAVHVVDTVLAPAFFLASVATTAIRPAGGRPGPTPRPSSWPTSWRRRRG